MLDQYEKQLRQTNLSENTILSYRYSLQQYLNTYGSSFSKKDLLAFKNSCRQ